jgi:hypothetical protein
MKFGRDRQTTGSHRGKIPVSRVIAVQRIRCPTEFLAVQVDSADLFSGGKSRFPLGQVSLAGRYVERLNEVRRPRAVSSNERRQPGGAKSGKVDHSAINKVCVKAHSASTQCRRGRNPLRRPICFNSSGLYLWELSVQMVSPSIKGTLQ